MKLPAVGLDVGSSTLRVLQFEGRPPTLRLTGYWSAPTPEGAVANGSVVDPRSLGSALEALFEESAVGPRRVVLALKGPGCFVKRMEVPAVAEEELAELIGWELEQVLPWDAQEAHFDYHLQRSGFDEEPHEVVVTAVRRDVLAGYRQALAAAELEPVAVDHTSFALENTFHLCFESDQQQTLALLDLGCTVTTVHVLEGNRTLAVADELIGGRAVVDHVASRCAVPAQEVERFLRGDRPEGVDAATAEVALQEAAEGVADRLLKAVNAMGYGPGAAPLADLVLGGGLSRVATVERCIGEALGASTEILNPFLGVEYDEDAWSHDQLRDMAPAAAVAVGLALRALRGT